MSKNTCWKNEKELSRFVRDGFEAPNCIPDSNYELKEESYYVTAKNRELTQKYKKTMEWIDELIKNGDKDVAEKMLKVFDKWKRDYDNKISFVKSIIKENGLNESVNPKTVQQRKEKIEKTKKMVLQQFEEDPETKRQFKKNFKKWLKDREKELLDYENKKIKKLPEYTYFHYDIMETIKIPNIRIVESKVRNTVDKMAEIDDWLSNELQKVENITDPSKSQIAMDKLTRDYHKLNAEKFPKKEK